MRQRESWVLSWIVTSAILLLLIRWDVADLHRGINALAWVRLSYEILLYLRWIVDNLTVTDNIGYKQLVHISEDMLI